MLKIKYPHSFMMRHKRRDLRIEKVKADVETCYIFLYEIGSGVNIKILTTFTDEIKSKDFHYLLLNSNSK